MKTRNIVAILSLLLSTYIQAYDFKTNGIYYSINSMETLEVEVVHGEERYSGDIVIPEVVSFREKEFKVVGVGLKAFNGCSITTVSIPEGVRYVDNWSFQNCRNLRSIDLPESLTGIGRSAFKNSGLTEIVIPDQVTQILDSAFVNCTDAKSITIGKSLKTDGLPYTTFIGCSNMEELIIRDSKEELMIGCYRRQGIENMTFGDFTKIKRLYVGRELKADYGSSLFPDNVEIEHLELGRFVRYFLPWTMDLKKVTIHRKVPFISNPSYRRQGNFTSKTKMDAILYVPEGCVDLYKEAELWKEFWTIKEIGK